MITSIVKSDEYLHDYQKLDNAIDKYYSHILRARCGWHIVDMSWENCFFPKREFHEQANQYFDNIKRNVQIWIYS